MQFSLAFLALAASATASAVNVPRAACSFTINVPGRGPLGQLSDGQVRVGGQNGITTFTINNGQITDAQGRGCILTPPTTQFQCDTGATPTSGFAIGTNGAITYNGNPTFYACPANNVAYNIYTQPVAGQTKCVAVTLNASGCFAATTPAPAPTQTVTATRTVTVAANCPAVVAPQTVTVTRVATAVVTPVVTVRPATSTTAPAPKTCPANLSGPYQFPHLIIPVDSTKPNTAAGTSYNGQISSTVSSIFNFDIPGSYTGTCSLVFLFPQQKDLQTSSFTFSGPGTVTFNRLSSIATQGTTFANQPAGTSLGQFTVTPGTSTVVSTFACPAGQTVSYSIKSVGGTALTYFQDYNPSPIGLYITAC